MPKNKDRYEVHAENKLHSRHTYHTQAVQVRDLLKSNGRKGVAIVDTLEPEENPLPKRRNLEERARRLNTQAQTAMHDHLHWVVGFVMSGKELACQSRLCSKDFKVYAPLQQKYRRSNRYVRGKERIAYPAIAGQLYIGMSDSDERWYELFNSNTIYGVLSSSGYPALLKGETLLNFIEDNKKKFTAKPVERHMVSRKEFSVGDTVEILDGIFEGQIASVNDIQGANAKMLIDMFGGETVANVPLDNLAKVG